MTEEEEERDGEASASRKNDRESVAAAASLDKLTDHVEETEMDTSNVQSAMKKLAEAQHKAKDDQLLREKRLAQVKIQQADVQIIATEFEVSTKKAEVRLREHDGNVIAALESFL